MSTIQDFETAPAGAIAKTKTGLAAWREGDETDDHPWVCTTCGEWLTNENMAERGYALVPPAPTTAQEALDLAWDLGHPLKEGQHIPEGTRLLDRSYRNDLSAYETMADITINAQESRTTRTLDPLPEPDPELDWFDAPALLATHKESHNYLNPTVWARDPSDSDRWVAGFVSAHWRDLRDVTPLYPKEDEEPRKPDTLHDTPRQRTISFHDDKPWGTKLGGDPA